MTEQPTPRTEHISDSYPGQVTPNTQQQATPDPQVQPDIDPDNEPTRVDPDQQAQPNPAA